MIARTVAPNLTVIPKGSPLSPLERAVLALLATGEPLTLPEIESQLFENGVQFTPGDLALAVVRLQELSIAGNTLAFYVRKESGDE